MHNRRKKSGKKFLLILTVFFILIIGGLLYKTASLVPVLFQLVVNKNINLKTSQNKINILLLGTGGGTHEGPNLTDSIIFASIDPKTNQIALISLPRDLWVPDLNGKINTAYAIGEQNKKGGGLLLAKAAVGKIVGQDINYGIRLDFNGFVKAVDLIGGLDVTVDNTFDDWAYPIEGKEDETCGHSQAELAGLASASSQLDAFPCRYMHIHFNTGLQHMDGQTALEFVRSRHALGEEGSDFARSRRQAKIITGFKNKVLSAETLLNPGKVISLFTVLQDSIDTDIKQDEFDDFIRLSQSMKGAKIISSVVDEGDSSQSRYGLLINPTPVAATGYAWILAPRTGSTDFSEIQTFVACQLSRPICIVPLIPTMTLPPLTTPTATPTKKK